TKRPVGFICVFAYTPNFSALEAGLTDRRGRYAISGLSTGRYIVEFDPCLAESALAGQIRRGRLRVVAGHWIRGVNEELGLGGSGPAGTGGRVAAGPRPAPGTCVDVLPLSSTASGSSTISLQGGGYQATNLAPGRYEIMAGAAACSSDEPSLAAKTTGPIQVAASQTTAGNVTLPTAGEITGLVRGTAGQPVPGTGAEGVPLRAGLGIPAGVPVTAGTSRIGDLQPGRYLVRFTSGCGATGYAARWYKNAPARAGATLVIVRPARVTAGINVTL